MAGRPSKLTPEIQTQICIWLRAGNFVETVCDYVGLHKDSFYEWMRRGERGWEADEKGGYVEFSDAVKKAISEVEIITLNEVRIGVDNWQSRAWWLERRHPDKWGNRQKVEHATSKDDPLTIEVRHINYRDGLTTIEN